MSPDPNLVNLIDKLIVAAQACFLILAVLAFLALPILLIRFSPRSGYVANILYAGFIVLVSILLAGENVSFFYDTPSFLWVYGLTAGFVLASGRGRLFAEGIAGAVKGDYESDRAEEIAAFFMRLFYAMIVIGLTGTLLGVMLMLRDLDPTKLGVGLAIALLTLFYAIGFGVVFVLPVAAGFRKNRTEK